MRIGAALVALTIAPPCWAGCNVTATALPFGPYDPTNAAATDGLGTVTVTCTQLVGLNTSWTVKLSKGGGSSYSPRALANGPAQLNYNIYMTSAHTTIWGDGSGGTSFVSDSQFLSIGTAIYTYTMYGRIPALQDVRAGAYSDSIVVTLTY